MNQSQNIFTDKYINHSWGSLESRSGPGSTVKQTENVRSELKHLILRYGIKSVTDFSCGDLNWIQLLFEHISQYTGCDIVQECIQNNTSKFPEHQFRCLDLATDEIPESDLLIVRDVIGHQPLDIGVKMLENIKKSKCKYLLSTTFETYGSTASVNPLTNKNVPIGSWYPVNLMNAPFSLPQPIESIQEIPPGKTLGLWELSST